MSQWHYKLGEKEHGPVSFSELVGLVRSGTITESVLVRRAASAAWARAWSIEMLFTAANRPLSDIEAPDAPSAARYAPRGATDADAARRTISPEQGPSPQAAVGGIEPRTMSHFRWAFTVAVSLTAVLSLHRWSYWQNLAFPRRGEHAADFVFPLLGQCTAAQCALLNFDFALVVGAIAWWLFRWVEEKQ